MEATRRPLAIRMLNSVPEGTIIFWIIKVMATTVGEMTSPTLLQRVCTSLKA